MPKRQFFFCECDSHALSVESFYDDSKFPIAIAMWAQGIPSHSLIHRIRDAWHAFRGDLFADNVALSRKEAKHLGKYLITLANQPTEKES